jgi:CheY-like chemotaxis protein
MTDSDAPASVLAGLRVLVVDDELLVADHLQALLEDVGCTVVGPCRHHRKSPGKRAK